MEAADMTDEEIRLQEQAIGMIKFVLRTLYFLVLLTALVVVGLEVVQVCHVQ